MIGLRFDWTGIPVGKVNLARLKKLSNERAGDYWHGHLLHRHWAAGAAERYGYQRRKPKYLRAKVKAAGKGKVLAGGRIDLLYTGQMRRLLTGTKINQPLPSHIRVRMSGPRYMTMRPYKSGRPPLGEEATRVVPEELDRMGTVYAERAAELLQAFFAGRP